MKDKMSIVIILIVVLIIAYFILSKTKGTNSGGVTTTVQSQTGLSTLFNTPAMGTLLAAMFNKDKDE